MSDEWTDEQTTAAFGTDTVEGQSVSTAIANKFKNKVSHRTQAVQTIVPDERTSIYSIAVSKGLSVEQYIAQNPQAAVANCTAICDFWFQLNSSLAVHGGLVDKDGKVYSVSKEQGIAIRTAYEAAERALQKVSNIALMYSDTNLREAVINALLRHGFENGDTRALTYLVDRIDGRPTEAATAIVKRDVNYNLYRLISGLFPKQQEVLNAGSGTILISCSRRAGKTVCLVFIALISALSTPGCTIIYIGPTAELAENLFAKYADMAVRQFGLTDSRGAPLDWKKLDNGSQILIRGLSNTKDPDQIRGQGAKIIIIDEFFHMRSNLLDYMQTQVLEPMQLDYADDYKFICAGTPPLIKGTYGEKAWKTWNVKKFSWTWRDNPYPTSFEARKKYIDNLLEKKGLTWDSPFARREYNGEWVYDEDLLLYPTYSCYDPSSNLPFAHVDNVYFGIDYGMSDCDALIGVVWNNSETVADMNDSGITSSAGRGFVFYEKKFSRLDLQSTSFTQLEYMKASVREAWEAALMFFPDMSPEEANKRILWMADDSDQQLTEELVSSISVKGLYLNIDNAHKRDKVLMYDNIRALLRTGNLLLVQDGLTAHECDSTVLVRGPRGEVYPEVDDSVFHPDLLSAMRYALWPVCGRGA